MVNFPSKLFGILLVAGALPLGLLAAPLRVVDASYPGQPGMCTPQDIYGGAVHMEYSMQPLGNGDVVSGYTQEWFDPYSSLCYDLQGVTYSANQWYYASVEAIAESWDTCDSMNWYAEIGTAGTWSNSWDAVAPVWHDNYLDCGPAQNHTYDDFNEGVYDNYWAVARWSGPY